MTEEGGGKEEGRGIILEEEVNDFRLVYENGREREREGDETTMVLLIRKREGRAPSFTTRKRNRVLFEIPSLSHSLIRMEIRIELSGDNGGGERGEESRF